MGCWGPATVMQLLGRGRRRHPHTLGQARLQELARHTKDVLSRSHGAANSAALDVQAKHKKLLQDFATLLQVRRDRRAGHHLQRCWSSDPVIKW